jgi:hypothetical protein
MDRDIIGVRQIRAQACAVGRNKRDESDREGNAYVNDKTILDQISTLVEEEHELLGLGEETGGLNDEQKARLQELKVHLDQCWDLLRQRRAKREFGQDPDDATTRDEKTVEGYRA